MGVQPVRESHAAASSGAFPYDILTTIGGEDDQIDDNFYLVVLCIDSTTRQANGVTLAGQSCTLKYRLRLSGNYPTIEVWYVDHPGGGGETLTIEDASSGGITFVWAVLEFSNVDPTDSLGSQFASVGDSTTPGTWTIAYRDSLVVGFHGIFGDLINGTPQSGDTELVDHPATNRNLIITAEPQPLESGIISVGTILDVSRTWLSYVVELLVTGTPIVTTSVVLIGVGNLSPTGQVFEGGNPTVTLTGIGNLSPTGTAGIMNGTVTMTGVGGLSVIGRLDDIYQDESQADSGGAASVDQAPTGP